MRYIEPCCIDHQLSEMLSSVGTHFFVTSGDITFEMLMRNVGAPLGGMKTVVICKKELTVYDCRLLAWMLGHGDWINGLLLVTQTDQSELVNKELGGNKDLYVYHTLPAMTDEMVVQWNGDKECVIVQGNLMSAPKKDNKGKTEKQLCHYATVRSKGMQCAWELLFGVWMHTHRTKTNNQFIVEFFNHNYNG